MLPPPCSPAGEGLAQVAALHRLLRALLGCYGSSFRPSLEQFVLLTDKLAAAVLGQLAAGSAAGAVQQQQLSELLQAGSLVLAAFRDMAAAHPAPKKVWGRADACQMHGRQKLLCSNTCLRRQHGATPAAPAPAPAPSCTLQVFSALCGKLFLPLCQLAAAGSSAGSGSDGAAQEQLQACSAAAQQLLLSAAYHQAHVQGLAEGCSQQAAKVGRHRLHASLRLLPPSGAAEAAWACTN
jgi:hypothetical protein